MPIFYDSSLFLTKCGHICCHISFVSSFLIFNENSVNVKFYILLTMHHVCFLVNDQCDAHIPFCIFIYNFTCFEHTVLIITRDKVYQCNLW